MPFESRLISEDLFLCLRSLKFVVWISTWIFDGVDSLGLPSLRVLAILPVWTFERLQASMIVWWLMVVVSIRSLCFGFSLAPIFLKHLSGGCWFFPLLCLCNRTSSASEFNQVHWGYLAFLFRVLLILHDWSFQPPQVSYFCHSMRHCEIFSFIFNGLWVFLLFFAY